MPVKADFMDDLARCERILDAPFDPRNADAVRQNNAVIDCLFAWLRYWAQHDPNLKVRAIWQGLEARASQELGRTLH